jgi:hypothetical protein
MIHSPFASKYLVGEQVTVSKMTFFHRICTELGQVFDSPFNWNNVFIAGGFLSGLLEANYDAELYKDSDIDLYVCAQNTNQLITRMNEVIKYLQTHTPNIYFLVSGYSQIMLIDCFIQGWKRRLQLIGITAGGSFPILLKKSGTKPDKCPTTEEVISAFDLTHCQIAFDGSDVICTPEFIDSMITRCSSINPQVHSVHAYRLVKTYLRGFSILQPKHSVFIKNYFHRYGEDDCKKTKGTCGIPIMTDRIWHTMSLQKEFTEIMDNPIVQQNLHKNFFVDFSLDVKQRLEEIEQKSEWTYDLYVFNRFGNCILIRAGNDACGKTHFIADRDDSQEQGSLPSLLRMTTHMSITNILVR